MKIVLYIVGGLVGLFVASTLVVAVLDGLRAYPGRVM